MSDPPSKPFDTTLRELVRADPAAWLSLAGWPSSAPVTVLDSNVSAVQAEVDAALLVEGPVPWVLHLEFQTSFDEHLPRRLDHYNHLLDYEHDRIVMSVAVLLRPAADGPGMTGVLERLGPNATPYRRFTYSIVRLWQRALEELLEGPLALVPLAPIVPLFEPSTDEDSRLRRTADVVQRIAERVRSEATAEEQPLLWTETYFVLGLRYPRDVAGRLLRGVRAMRDSLTYQAVLEEGRAEGEARGRAEGRAEGESRGRVEEARRLLRQLGEHRFGAPDSSTLATIDSLGDVDRIERATLRLLEAASWEDALAT